MKLTRTTLGCITLCLAATALQSRGNDLAGLNDDFSADTADQWLRRHLVEGGQEQLERFDFSPADAPGQLLMMPHTSTWYESWRGALAYKNVTGDFALTTRIVVSNRAGTGVPGSDFSLAGVMLRVPSTGAADPEDYVFLALGHGSGGAAQFEVKTTAAGTSTLQLQPSGTLEADLQIARVADKIITLYRRPTDADWVVHRVFDDASADPALLHTLGAGELQAGFIAYTDWPKASTFTTDYHNANALTADDNAASGNPGLTFNPDLIARFDHATFHRLNVPGGIADGATDAQILAVLGDNAIPEPAALVLLPAAATLLLRRR